MVAVSLKKKGRRRIRRPSRPGAPRRVHQRLERMGRGRGPRAERPIRPDVPPSRPRCRLRLSPTATRRPWTAVTTGLASPLVRTAPRRLARCRPRRSRGRPGPDLMPLERRRPRHGPRHRRSPPRHPPPFGRTARRPRPWSAEAVENAREGLLWTVQIDIEETHDETEATAVLLLHGERLGGAAKKGQRRQACWRSPPALVQGLP